MSTTTLPRAQRHRAASGIRRLLSSLASAVAALVVISSPASASQHIRDAFDASGSEPSGTSVPTGLPVWIILTVIVGSALVAVVTTLVTMRLRGPLREIPA